MSAEENKACSRRVFEEVWNQGKLYLIGELFATDFVGHIPGGPEIHGQEGVKQVLTMFRTAFPDIKLTVEDQIAEGDKGVTRLTYSGTHKGELMGIQPTGLQATWTGITFCRYAGGKTVEAWGEYDALGLMQQLGVIPTIGQGEE